MAPRRGRVVGEPAASLPAPRRDRAEDPDRSGFPPRLAERVGQSPEAGAHPTRD